jgi:uncharacterized protein (TIGR01777 family)
MSIVAITGGTGLVGTALCEGLRREGHEVRIFSRGESRTQGELRYCHWDPEKGVIDPNDLKDVEVVVNLAGARIAGKRWTAQYKKELYNSRIQATELLVENLRNAAPNCRKFVSASAVGYYGEDNGLPFVETDSAATDFLGNLCRDWEAAAQKAEAFCAVQILRFGIVLDHEQGALPQMIAPFKFGLMPIPGDGTQIISWIHVDDLIATLMDAVEDAEWSGVFNLVASQPVSQEVLLKTYAKLAYYKVLAFHVPSFLLKIALGQSTEAILTSTRVSNEKLRQSGFQFQFATIESALDNLSRR